MGAGLPGIRRLKRAELPADTTALARLLIGRLLVRELDGERLVGRIVETEAYLVGDAASHAFRGKTARNGAMFLERGHAYVYFIYGVSFMLNVSAEAEHVGAGVLFRAIEPVEGIERMRALRGRRGRSRYRPRSGAVGFGAGHRSVARWRRYVRAGAALARR